MEEVVEFKALGGSNIHPCHCIIVRVAFECGKVYSKVLDNIF